MLYRNCFEYQLFKYKINQKAKKLQRKNVGKRGAGVFNLTFAWAWWWGEGGAIQTLYIYNIIIFALPKDITKVISRSRDKLVEIRVIGYCHVCK